jgi:hypothetical protein
MGPEPARGRHPFLARRFESEAGFRRRVKVARLQGVPPSQLDGREPAETTEHQYDGAGRLVRSMTVREPLYTEQDRAELLAYELYLEGLCPLCGQPVEVCTSHEETGPEFTATYTMCRATAAQLERQRAMTDGGRKPRLNAPAYLWSTIRKG